MKKLLTVVLAICLVLSMNVMAFAGPSQGGSTEPDIPAALPESSNNTTNNTTTNTDGSTTYTAAGNTTTTTTADGSKVATTTTSDGTKVVAAEKTAEDGTKEVEVKVTLSETAAKADEVVIKTEVAAADEPTIVIEMPATVTEEVTVAVPVKDASVNTVAVIVKADGTEEVVCATKQTKDGVAIKLEEGATIKIVDNKKEFNDVEEAKWAEDNIAFVTSREIFQGVAEKEFAPNDTITRQMAFTALARFDGNNKAQYAEGLNWATESKISDGSNPGADITREELATLLWRYAGSPAMTGTVSGFADGAEVSSWAAQAIQWCISKGIFNGIATENGNVLLPGATASRAELAAVIQRFCNAF